MTKIDIEGTFMTPRVVLNPETNEFFITGNSRPENPLAFYKPIFAWFEEYFQENDTQINFLIYLEYFNTSTSKIIMDLFELFERVNENSTKAHVIWQYNSGDEEMKDAGEELFDLVPISGELKEF